MKPILKSGDRLQIVPYDGLKIRQGDVIFFTHPEDGTKIVHRVVSVDSQGIRTRGDHCSHVDSWALSPDHVIGRVVYAQRGNRRRRIFGGTIGRIFAGAVRAIHLIDRAVCFLLRPTYDWLIRMGFFRRWMSGKMKMRVLFFKRPYGTELQLLMGRRVIGRWLPGRTRWHIRRPFRLFVDEAELPKMDNE